MTDEPRPDPEIPYVHGRVFRTKNRHTTMTMAEVHAEEAREIKRRQREAERERRRDEKHDAELREVAAIRERVMAESLARVMADPLIQRACRQCHALPGVICADVNGGPLLRQIGTHGPYHLVGHIFHEARRTGRIDPPWQWFTNRKGERVPIPSNATASEIAALRRSL